MLFSNDLSFAANNKLFDYNQQVVFYKQAVDWFQSLLMFFST